MKIGKIFEDEFYKIIIAKTGELSILEKDSFDKRHDKKILLPKYVFNTIKKSIESES